MEDMHIHLKSGVTDISIMRNYIKRCKELKINKVLFLDHGNRMSEKHIPILNKSETINKFFENIDTIRKEFPEMNINKGIESDFSYDEQFKEKELKILKEYQFDLVIGSVHGMAKEEYGKYLKANIDMINTYPINIIGHLKLRKEYEQFKELIEEIVRLATVKNIAIEINTSERSRWNLKQLEYMLDLFKKYGTQYTLGSDAHCIEEIGYHVQEEYTKINKILNNLERDIEYTIVSRGTEKNGSDGYMGLTKIENNKRQLILAKYYDKYIDTYKDSYEISADYSIENIAISRFELICALALNPILKLIKEDILIIGLGNLGFSCLLFLLDMGFKKISVSSRNINDNEKKAIEKLNKTYKSNIKIDNLYENYKTYIEAIGSSDVIRKIMENVDYNSSIVLLGTPKEETYFLNPLDINRKNLKIIGGHEVNGHTIEEKRELFEMLLKNNKEKDLKQYVNVYSYKDGIREKILKSKENFIEVIKYDI